MEDKDIKLIKEIIKEYSTMDGLKEYTKALEKLLQAYKQDEKVIEEMALYIRSIKTDYNQEYCNVENCNYHKTNCSSKCIIDYFRKEYNNG